MKKFLHSTIFRLLLIWLPFCSANTVFANQSCQPDQTNTQKYFEKFGDLLLDALIEAGPEAIASLYFCLFSNHEVKETLKNQLYPKALLINFATQFSSHLIATIAHEVGHAIMAKILVNKTPREIHIGANSAKKRRSIFSAKLLKIDGLNPTQAYSTLKPSANTNKTKYAAIYLAGGICAILIHYLENAIKKPFTEENKEIITFDPVVLEQLTNAFLPISQTSDAARVWKKCLNFSEKTINIGTYFQYLFYKISDFYITHKQTSCNQATMLDKLMLTLINSRVKGFLRFNV